MYAPGATAEDRERYRAALAANRERPSPQPGPDGPRRSPGAGRVRRLLTALAVPAVVALAVLLSRAVPGSTSPSLTPIAIDAAERAGLIRNLTDGGPPGLTTLLLEHGRIRSSAIRQGPMEHWGLGPGTVSLTLSAPPAKVGSVTVVLVCDRSAAASWTALSLRPVAGSDDPAGPVAERGGSQRPGVPTTGTFVYPAGHPPLQLWIDVPKDVHWGVVVVFTD
jgi:hypothetical protein